MAFNDPRASAVGTRGLAAKQFMDEEERRRQLMATPPIQFNQPVAGEPEEGRLAGAKRTQMAQEEEAAKASENERLTAEQWAELGLTVAGGALGGAFLGPAGTYLGPILAGAALGSGGTRAATNIARSIKPGPVDELRASRGDDLGGKRALQGATGAGGALKTGGAAVGAYDAQQAKFDEEAIGAQLDTAIAKRTPRGMAEAEFLSTDVGRRAYLGKSYGRDPSYMGVFEEWLDRNR